MIFQACMRGADLVECEGAPRQRCLHTLVHYATNSMTCPEKHVIHVLEILSTSILISKQIGLSVPNST